MCKHLRWMLGCGVLLVGMGAFSAWAGEAGTAPASTVADIEQGLVITADGLFPKTLYVPENTPCSLWVVNGTPDAGVLSVALSEPVVSELKKNKLTEVKLGSLAAGEHTLEFKVGKEGAVLGGVLQVGGKANTTAAQAVTILAGNKQFKPEVTRVRANQPVEIYWYTSSFIPHGEFELPGTEVTFKPKSKQLDKVELKQGLPAGTYPISRPGHAKQNHGITSRVVVE